MPPLRPMACATLIVLVFDVACARTDVAAYRRGDGGAVGDASVLGDSLVCGIPSPCEQCESCGSCYDGDASADRELPSIDCLDLNVGELWSGVVTISGRASDNTGIAEVWWRAYSATQGDNVSMSGVLPIDRASSPLPFAIDIDTNQLPDDSYVMSVFVADAAGNGNSYSTTVTFANPGGSLSELSFGGCEVWCGDQSLTGVAHYPSNIAALQLTLSGPDPATPLVITYNAPSPTSDLPFFFVFQTDAFDDGDYLLTVTIQPDLSVPVPPRRTFPVTFHNH